jgi:hypothetical protein
VQIGNLRRIGNPPAVGVQRPLIGRIANPPQDAILHYMAVESFHG